MRLIGFWLIGYNPITRFSIQNYEINDTTILTGICLNPLQKKCTIISTLQDNFVFNSINLL